MDKIALSVCAFFLLACLLIFRWRNKRGAIIVFKTTLSALFVYVAFRYPSPVSWYYRFILAGLILCFFGDFMLALTSKRAFRMGLGLFLLGHVGYAIGFFSLVSLDLSLLGIVVPVAGIGVFVYRRLKPYLGTMQLPVLAYIFGISWMLLGALSVLLWSKWSLHGRWMVFVGAFLFYLSDCLVARNRFVREQFINRLIGLPLYYAGQFIIAFSLAEM